MSDSHKDDTSIGAHVALTRLIRRRVSSLINTLSKHHSFEYFLLPVDASDIGCGDYYNIILTPMELGTISKRLQLDSIDTAAYRSTEQIHADFRQIFSNCRLFNHGNKDMLEICEEAELLYFQEWNTLALPEIVLNGNDNGPSEKRKMKPARRRRGKETSLRSSTESSSQTAKPAAIRHRPATNSARSTVNSIAASEVSTVNTKDLDTQRTHLLPASATSVLPNVALENDAESQVPSSDSTQSKHRDQQDVPAMPELGSALPALPTAQTCTPIIKKRMAAKVPSTQYPTGLPQASYPAMPSHTNNPILPPHVPPTAVQKNAAPRRCSEPKRDSTQSQSVDLNGSRTTGNTSALQNAYQTGNVPVTSNHSSTMSKDQSSRLIGMKRKIEAMRESKGDAIHRRRSNSSSVTSLVSTNSNLLSRRPMATSKDVNPAVNPSKRTLLSNKKPNDNTSNSNLGRPNDKASGHSIKSTTLVTPQVRENSGSVVTSESKHAKVLSGKQLVKSESVVSQRPRLTTSSKLQKLGRQSPNARVRTPRVSAAALLHAKKKRLRETRELSHKTEMPLQDSVRPTSVKSEVVLPSSTVPNIKPEAVFSTTVIEAKTALTPDETITPPVALPSGDASEDSLMSEIDDIKSASDDGVPLAMTPVVLTEDFSLSIPRRNRSADEEVDCPTGRMLRRQSSSLMTDPSEEPPITFAVDEQECSPITPLDDPIADMEDFNSFDNQANSRGDDDVSPMTPIRFVPLVHADSTQASVMDSLPEISTGTPVQDENIGPRDFSKEITLVAPSGSEITAVSTNDHEVLDDSKVPVRDDPDVNRSVPSDERIVVDSSADRSEVAIESTVPYTNYTTVVAEAQNTPRIRKKTKRRKKQDKADMEEEDGALTENERDEPVMPPSNDDRIVGLPEKQEIAEPSDDDELIAPPSKLHTGRSLSNGKRGSKQTRGSSSIDQPSVKRRIVLKVHTASLIEDEVVDTIAAASPSASVTPVSQDARLKKKAPNPSLSQIRQFLTDNKAKDKKKTIRQTSIMDGEEGGESDSGNSSVVSSVVSSAVVFSKKKPAINKFALPEYGVEAANATAKVTSTVGTSENKPSSKSRSRITKLGEAQKPILLEAAPLGGSNTDFTRMKYLERSILHGLPYPARDNLAATSVEDHHSIESSSQVSQKRAWNPPPPEALKPDVSKPPLKISLSSRNRPREVSSKVDGGAPAKHHDAMPSRKQPGSGALIKLRLKNTRTENLLLAFNPTSDADMVSTDMRSGQIEDLGDYGMYEQMVEDVSVGTNDLPRETERVESMTETKGPWVMLQQHFVPRIPFITDCVKLGTVVQEMIFGMAKDVHSTVSQPSKTHPFEYRSSLPFIADQLIESQIELSMNCPSPRSPSSLQTYSRQSKYGDQDIDDCDLLGATPSPLTDRMTTRVDDVRVESIPSEIRSDLGYSATLRFPSVSQLLSIKKKVRLMRNEQKNSKDQKFELSVTLAQKQMRIAGFSLVSMNNNFGARIIQAFLCSRQNNHGSDLTVGCDIESHNGDHEQSIPFLDSLIQRDSLGGASMVNIVLIPANWRASHRAFKSNRFAPDLSDGDMWCKLMPPGSNVPKRDLRFLCRFISKSEKNRECAGMDMAVSASLSVRTKTCTVTLSNQRSTPMASLSPSKSIGLTNTMVLDRSLQGNRIEPKIEDEDENTITSLSFSLPLSSSKWQKALDELSLEERQLDGRTVTAGDGITITNRLSETETSLHRVGSYGSLGSNRKSVTEASMASF